MNRLALVAAILAFALSAYSAPQLKAQAELVDEKEGIKMKVLANSHGLPPPTLVITKMISSAGEKMQYCKSDDLWRSSSIVGTWKDKKGNELRLVRVDSLPPEGRETNFGVLIKKEDAESAMKRARDAFAQDEETFAAWKKAWKALNCSMIATTKSGKSYLIEFAFAETVKPEAEKRLLKDAAASLSSSTSGMTSAYSSMKWWSTDTKNYKFLTDLDKSKGGRFVSDTSKLAEAMRKAYEKYVPADKKVGLCTVRVFKTLDGYREYRQSTGSDDQTSCGLWDPGREELLIAAENKDSARSTMRHEGFHQYLYYATGRGDHAMWFNEGHATFFENIKYNNAKNTVKIVEEGNRAMWVAKNPERHANHMKKLIKMTHSEYYSGDVNLNYCTGWALVYFLQKGAHAVEEFKAYRKVIPTYLEAMNRGASAAEASDEAFKCVADRDLKEDFLEFWARYRKNAAKFD